MTSSNTVPVMLFVQTFSHAKTKGLAPGCYHEDLQQPAWCASDLDCFMHSIIQYYLGQIFKQQVHQQ